MVASPIASSAPTTPAPSQGANTAFTSPQQAEATLKNAFNPTTPQQQAAIQNAANLVPNKEVQPTKTVEPTVLSSANINNNTLPNLGATINNLSQNRGVTTDQNGNQIYPNGTLVNKGPYKQLPDGSIVTNDQNQSVVAHPGSNITNAAGQQLTGVDSNGNLTFGNATLSGTTETVGEDGLVHHANGLVTVPDPANSPEVQNIMSTWDNLKAQSDSFFATQVQNIQQSFNNLLAQQKADNQAVLDARNQSLLMSGSARYAQISSQGIVMSQLDYNNRQLSNIIAKENDALSAAQKAYQDQEYQIASKKVDVYQSIQTEKNNILQKQADLINSIAEKQMADRFQASKDTAIASIMQQGITDPSKILTELQNQGIDTISSKDITDAITNMNPQQKDVLGILTTASNNFAPADILQKIASAKNVQEAVEAAGGYLTAVGQYDIQKITDAFGNESLVAVNKKNPKERIAIGAGGGSSIQGGIPANTSSNPNVHSTTGLSFTQYGLLANTNFSPNNQVDQLAQKYLDQYIKNGQVPNAYTLGRSIKPAALAEIDNRARDLYFQATGNPLPNPEVIKNYQQILFNNNKMANNLKIQENTVKANIDLSLQNLKSHDINSNSFRPLDNFLNSLGDLFNDPNVGQLLAQNTTIQNELGSLLAVKNASGTTVYDKMTSAGIISSSDTPADIQRKVTALINEAGNFADSINGANADIYKQIDPFLQDPNNPYRAQAMKTSDQKMQDYFVNNPDKRTGIEKALNNFKQNKGRDMTPDEFLQAFPEANMAITGLK